jgi:hypothetical protein
MMLLIVSETVEHPKLLSGLVSFANIIDTLIPSGVLNIRRRLEYLKDLGHRQCLWLLGAFSMTKATGGRRSFLQHRATPPMAWDPRSIRKQIKKPSPQAASKRYRWYVPAGLFRYLAISRYPHLLEYPKILSNMMDFLDIFQYFQAQSVPLNSEELREASKTVRYQIMHQVTANCSGTKCRSSSRFPWAVVLPAFQLNADARRHL